MFFDSQPLKLHSCQCWQTPFFQAKSALILVYLGKNQHHIPDQISQNCCLSRGKSTGKYHIVDKNPGSTIMDQQWMLVNSQRISACFLRFLAPSGPSAQHGSNFRTVRRKGRFRACGNDHPWINMAGKSSINRWCSLHGFGDFPRLMSQLVFIYGLRFAKFVPVKKNLKNTETQMAKITQKSWLIHILPIFYMFLWCLAIFCPFFMARNIMAKTGRDTQPWPPWQGATRVLESERWRQWPPKWGKGFTQQMGYDRYDVPDKMILDDTGWYWMILMLTLPWYPKS